MTNWNDLISGEDLQKMAKERKKEYDRETVSKDNIFLKEHKGWSIVKQYKNGNALMERKKSIGDAFEDEVWSIFYKMGFKVMNASRDFVVSYSDNNPGLTKQIDVVAIDDEVCLLIECKSSEKMNKLTSWKTTLESIDGYKGKVFKELKKIYKDRKFKYIFATKNYVIGTQDKSRMEDFKIANFDYETIRYYDQLVNHLGSAAKYQLLANLFANEEIKGMNNKVPAIKGKMGGLEYYSFSIEPERLLKIAYVLHRNNANHLMMPTYQRIIKKERLKSVREYIDNKNFFPNSLIVSIDTKGEKLQFDRASLQVTDSISKIGVLHLPKTYQSAYIIDGQHRLYGYSDSKYASTSSIPVVAFVNLDKSEQLKMFMDVNENQKAVSKSLRNTLNIDLLWNSEKYSERNTAIMLDIGQRLGEDVKSPLYGRVVTGENTTTQDRCITLEYIKDALNKTSFFNDYKKNNEISRHGTLAKGTNDDTIDNVYPMLLKYFNTIEDYCKEQWDRGSEGYLTINNSVFSLIKILNDIFNLVLTKKGKSSATNWEEIYNDCEDYVLSLCDTILDLGDKEIQTIKKAKGGSAKTESWRTWQVALYNKNNKFINDDLKHYMEEKCIDYSEDVLEGLKNAKAKFKEIIKNEFEKDESWLDRLLPEDLQENIIGGRAIEAHKKGISIDDFDVWELISFEEMLKMIDYGSNWSNLLQKHFNDGTKDKKITKQLIKTNVAFLIKLEKKNKIKQRFTKSDLDNLYEILSFFYSKEELWSHC